MTPLRLFHHDPDTLEITEIYFHPYHQTFRYLGCLISAVTYWMRTKDKLKDDYLRVPPRPSRWRAMNINERLHVKWQLKAKR